MQLIQVKESSDEDQRQRAKIFFKLIHLAVIMFEISPGDPGRDHVCEFAPENAVTNTLSSRLTPALWMVFWF